jgi:hypothetical protein
MLDKGQEGEMNATAQSLLPEAFAMADELDAVRTVYGEPCLTFVKKALMVSDNPSWQTIVEDAVRRWTDENRPIAHELNL